MAADPAVTAVDAHAIELESRLVAEGLLPGYDVKLSAMSDWAELEQLWNESSQPVLAAKNARADVAERIANDRMTQGKFETIFLRDKQKSAHGGYPGPWNDLQHPDEWIVNRYSDRKLDGPIVEHVRIRPGEDNGMDEATSTFRAAEAGRRVAIAKFLTEHVRSPGSPR